MTKMVSNPNRMPEKTELVLFKDGEINLEVPVIPEEETVWLNQAQMVELYGRDTSVISRHIRNIFKEGELDKESNLHFLQIANSDRPVAFYSLDVIISVGYRVKSHRGIAFRKWANGVLKQYILRGYAVNENRMKQLGEVVRLMKRTQESLDSKQVLSVIRRRQPTCCTLSQKTIAFGTAINVLQRQCFCTFWIGTEYSTTRQGTNGWLISRWWH